MRGIAGEAQPTRRGHANPLNRTTPVDPKGRHGQMTRHARSLRPPAAMNSSMPPVNCAYTWSVAASAVMALDKEATVELIGALATSLSHALAVATPEQLNRLESEILVLLESVEADSVAANAFRSVLRDISERLAALSPQ